MKNETRGTGLKCLIFNERKDKNGKRTKGKAF